MSTSLQREPVTFTVQASLNTVFPNPCPDSNEQVIIVPLQGLDDELIIGIKCAGAGRQMKHAGPGTGKHCLHINRDMNPKTSTQMSYLVNYMCFFW